MFRLMGKKIIFFKLGFSPHQLWLRRNWSPQGVLWLTQHNLWFRLENRKK